ncbi:MAG: hypothetical protein U1C33_04230, partial [Candidatus Cloacimonadaceae bacterium]|nr:hypothetical protein [Candidatus Cloacimonadaceae bacterium]
AILTSGFNNLREFLSDRNWHIWCNAYIEPELEKEESDEQILDKLKDHYLPFSYYQELDIATHIVDEILKEYVAQKKSAINIISEYMTDLENSKTFKKKRWYNDVLTDLEKEIDNIMNDSIIESSSKGFGFLYMIHYLEYSMKDAYRKAHISLLRKDYAKMLQQLAEKVTKYRDATAKLFEEQQEREKLEKKLEEQAQRNKINNLQDLTLTITISYDGKKNVPHYKFMHNGKLYKDAKQIKTKGRPKPLLSEPQWKLLVDYIQAIVPTPTPNASGKYIYKVKSNDSHVCKAPRDIKIDKINREIRKFLSLDPYSKNNQLISKTNNSIIFKCDVTLIE